MHNFTPCPNLEKIMIQSQENVWTDGRTEGRTDSFHRTLPATADKTGPK